MSRRPKANPFTDVPSGAYYYDAVLWAAENGVTDGVTATLFAPDAPCTRAQIVTFLWRAAGSPEPNGTSTFTDVPASAYYAKAVAWAVENGITDGTSETTFSPDAPCTRGQSVTFLYRARKGRSKREHRLHRCARGRVLRHPRRLGRRKRRDERHG